MGSWIEIESEDGFKFQAYRAFPEGAPKAAVLVIQEIFGVNSHIRAVADGYAAAGYVALAPAIFDRAKSGVELGYDAEGMNQGIDLAFKQLKMPETLTDLGASVRYLSQYGRVGVVGYCFGGLLAYLSACNLKGISCSVGYYGGGIVGVLEQSPTIPLMLHFGGLDTHIPQSDIDQIKAALPETPIHVYPEADHGFNCDMRDSFNEQASKLALERSLAFFSEYLS